MSVQLLTLLMLARRGMPFLPAYLASLAVGELAAKGYVACEDLHKLATAQESASAAVQ